MVEPKLDETPWTIRQTFLGISITLIPWVAFALTLSSFGNQPTRSTALSFQADLSSAIVILLFSCVIEGAFLIAPLYFAKHTLRSILPHRLLAWRALGFRRFPVGNALLWIIILLIAILAVDNLYQYAITITHVNLQTNDQIIIERSKSAPISTYATLIAAVFIAPFCEEVFFRGFVFAGLRREMPLVWAIVLSALLFAIAHADPGSFAVLFIIGLVLAFLRWRTNSLWPSILLHLINNGLGALLIVLIMQGIVKA